MKQTLTRYLSILKAHYKAAIAVFLITLSAGVAVTLMLPKRYVATTDLVFDLKSDPVAGMMLPVIPGYMATQVDIIKSDRVAMAVIKLLRLDQSPSVQKQWMDATGGKLRIETWFADILRGGLRVSPAQGSNIMTISYSAGDPAFAATVANAFAQVYIDASIELKVEPARQYARWFDEQGKSAREALEKAQTRLSQFQQEKGIVTRDERLDIESKKLDDLSAQLTTLQSQTAETRSKQRSGEDTLPEVMQNSLIQGLKSEILKLEAKMQESAQNLGKNHPQYLRMQSELSALRKQLESETRNVTRSFQTSSTVGQDREAALLAAINAQKQKLLKLRNERDQLAVLQRDVDAAQAAYESVTKRFNQSSLESQATQSNISVLNAAAEPTSASSPAINRNIGMSFVLGIALAIGVALLLEKLNPRIRTLQDLEAMLPIPVLASIQRPRKESRLIRLLTRRKPVLALR